jgi:PAS domain S-box-containing protein
MMNLNQQTSVVTEFATYLQDHHLEALAAENLRLNHAFGSPLLKLFAHVPEADMQRMGVEGMATFLTDLAAGRALAVYEETLKAWAEDRLPGIPRDAVEPADLVLVYAAQKQAILKYLPHFTRDADRLLAVMLELEDYYVRAQNAALTVFDRLRVEAVQRAVQADAAHQAALEVAEGLRASEARFRQLADSMPHLVWTTRADGYHDYYNERWYAYTGMTEGQTDDWGWRELLHPDDVERATEVWTRSLQTGIPYEVTYRFRRHDGEYRWFVGRALPVRDDAGHITKWYGTCTDMHERHLMETALQAANDRLGLQAEELQAANEELSSQAEELASQQEELNALYDELRSHADHIEAQVQERTQELQAANEELAAQSEELLLQSEELLKANEAIEGSRSLLDGVLNNLPGAVAYCDKDQIIRMVNRPYAAQLGRQVDEIVNRPIQEVFAEHLDQLLPILDQVKATGEPWRAFGLPGRQADGQPGFHDAVVVPVRDRAGQGGGWLSLSFDATERMRLAAEAERLQAEHIAQLQQADRYKDEFISVISHELRTPLNFIMGFASLLEDEVPGPLTTGQAEHVGKILHGADRMLALVDDLLDFARIRAGSFSLAPELAAFDVLVEDTAASVRPLAEAKGVTLRVEANRGLMARVDVQRVTQVVTNLLSNAIKFTERGGTVLVTCRAEGGRVHCEVTDTGCGIAESDIPRLFRRFQQLDMSTTRQAGGAGLGLSIAKALVEAHAGDIGVRSRLGEGSTFHFSLPAGARPAPAPRHPRGAPAQPAGAPLFSCGRLSRGSGRAARRGASPWPPGSWPRS